MFKCFYNKDQFRPSESNAQSRTERVKFIQSPVISTWFWRHEIKHKKRCKSIYICFHGCQSLMQWKTN